MAAHVDIDMSGDAREVLRNEWLTAKQEAASALFALSECLFVSPALHDGLHGSVPFQHWRSCAERVRRLEEDFDASAHGT